MASERNRILDLVKYIESCGVQVNIGKNKARGNKGYFKATNNSFRIDIAKGQSEVAIIKILAHEFAHFVHFTNDKTLKSLDFIFSSDADITEELLAITVDSIPKNQVKKIYEEKETLKAAIKELAKPIKEVYKDFKPSCCCAELENKIKKTVFKHLLKYDKVKVLEGFKINIYSIDDLQNNSIEECYIKLKSKQRKLKRITSKISRLNKYYNTPTELFARSFELFMTDRIRLKQIAPKIFDAYEQMMLNEQNLLLINFVKILN